MTHNSLLSSTHADGQMADGHSSRCVELVDGSVVQWQDAQLMLVAGHRVSSSIVSGNCYVQASVRFPPQGRKV